METKIISHNIIIASLILSLGFGIVLAQEYQNGESSLFACQAWVREYEGGGNFTDVSQKLAAPVAFSELLGDTIGGTDGEAAKFFPKKAITRQDFALLLQRYATALNTTVKFEE